MLVKVRDAAGVLLMGGRGRAARLATPTLLDASPRGLIVSETFERLDRCFPETGVRPFLRAAEGVDAAGAVGRVAGGSLN